ncbi:MAG: glycosyltransferase [Planctomycetaceae bacterium]|nr:glycosyltransferase [Planctomycetaceae bacterium]
MRGLAALAEWRWFIKRAVHAVLMPIVRWLLLKSPAARANQSVVRSLWGVTPILTLATKSRAERMLGVDARSLVYETYHLAHQFDINLARWMRGPLKLVTPYVVFYWAARRFQRFHFFYDRGLLPQLEPGQFNRDELILLHALGKQLFGYAYGADVRTQVATRSLGPVQLCAGCPAPGRHCVCDDARGTANYHRFRHFATTCFSMGDMIEYTPGSRNDLFYWPLDLDADGGERYRPHYPTPTANRPLRVVHAANHRFFKGTRYLLDAIERLRGEGIEIELVLVEKKSNDEALELYRTADVVFDQCVSGFHGYFTLEAMAMGKPVLVYVRKPDEYLLAADECPLVQTHPRTLVDDLRRLALNREPLTDIGQRGRDYIERYYSLDAFAARLTRVYRELGEASTPQTSRRPVTLRFHGPERLRGPYLDHSKAA